MLCCFLTTAEGRLASARPDLLEIQRQPGKPGRSIEAAGRIDPPRRGRGIGQRFPDLHRSSDWLHQAQADLELAGVSAAAGHQEWACVGCHQAVEKAPPWRGFFVAAVSGDSFSAFRP